MSDLIDRQAAIDALDKRFDDVPMELTTEILQLRHDLRERIPSAQPATNCSEIPNSSDDTISRQAAIEALARMMPRSYTPDGSHPADEEIFRAQEVFADCIEALEILPSAQPEILACGEGELNVPDTNVGDMISRQAAIDALDEQIEQCNRALSSFDISPKDEYAIKVERASLEAYKEQLENVPSAQPTLCGYNIEHLILIANVLRKENLPPERVVEALTDIGRIVSIVKDEFEESLRKAVEQCKV